VVQRSRVLAAVFVFLATASVAMAQTGATATVRGQVRDPQGRAVSGAKVAVMSVATGLVREAPSDETGAFAITDLAPGDVTITVAAPNFAEQRYTDVKLRVGQTLDLPVALSVAGVNEAVTVAGTAVGVVDTSRSVVDAVIGSQAIDKLPLNGRNFLELALLVPGNTPAPNFDPTKSSSVLISSAGQFGRGGNVTIDGMDNNDDVVGGPLLNVAQDSVQEFQIATSRFSAELGRSAGSVINVVTRSGGDQTHGSASAFFRDDSLQALPATYDKSAGDTIPFSRQQYSASVGGPIKKDTLFAFGAIEYRNQNGAVLVGSRDDATRTIKKTFADAPADDLLATARGDWRPNANNQLMIRYSGERVDDTGQTKLDRAIGSATQRQRSQNHYNAVLGTWTRIFSPRSLNSLSVSVSTFHNTIDPTSPGLPQYTFPSIADGTSFRVPQSTDQRRWQIADTWSQTLGAHVIKAGGEFQRVDSGFGLDVFRAGRVEFIQDFPFGDLNGDGRVDDNDLLFAVTIRSGHPETGITLPNCDNNHTALFFQDDWRLRSNLTVNVGLRYEIDSNVKNISGYGDINPIVQPFLQGDRHADKNNFSPRIGFNWSAGTHTSVHGGYGIYYDRITLEIMSLERGLDGRTLPIEVRAGNVFFLPENGPPILPPFAPSFSDPFTGFILPGAGAGGINIIDNGMQNPTVQQFNLGFEHEFSGGWLARVDGIHAHGTHFIIGRKIGEVFNPVVGGPDSVINLEDSVGTMYDGLLTSVERRFNAGLYFRASYTLAKAFNYANDDQIPFAAGPLDPTNLQKEYGPTPADRRHRFTFAGTWNGVAGLNLSAIWTLSSGVPMDILMPDGQTRIPVLQRNAGDRQFKDAGELNAYIQDLNAKGGINGVPLPTVSNSAKFSDTFNSVDLRVSRPFNVGKNTRIEPIVEVFNVFNVTNILGVSNLNYSGYSNVLVRDGAAGTPGFLTSSAFGKPVTTAGGVFGSGGPRAFQLAARVTF
jgi:outer membrane receptor protein involved in Fe transport